MEGERIAHYQVTVDRDVLQGLFVRDDGLSRLVENIVNQVLDAQAVEQLKAKPYERTEEHQGYRNLVPGEAAQVPYRKARVAGSQAAKRALLHGTF